MRNDGRGRQGDAAPLRVVDPAAVVPSAEGAVTARLRGAAMRDARGVFAEFARRLRLPDHFGWNWDALNDCLRDLAWLPRDAHPDACLAYLFVVEDARLLLDREPERRRTLFEVLAGAGEDWSAAGVPFTVLLLAGPPHAEALRAELAAYVS